jgi:hypothetical protein
MIHRETTTVRALATADVLSEIAGYLERGSLALFIQVNGAFHRVGITRLWRRLHSLSPLLAVLMPPNVGVYNHT